MEDAWFLLCLAIFALTVSVSVSFHDGDVVDKVPRKDKREVFRLRRKLRAKFSSPKKHAYVRGKRDVDPEHLHDADAIDHFFDHPDPDSALTNEIESFVLNNGDPNIAYHPYGIEEIEKLKSKVKAENFDHHLSEELLESPGDVGKRKFRRRKKREFPGWANLWPKGIIPYEIDASLSRPDAHDNIRTAIQQFSDLTCIKWVNRSSDEATTLTHNHYITFKSVSAKGCESFLGMKTDLQGQPLYLRYPGCDFVDIIVHEMAHAVGLNHEQTRIDRDKYVIMNWNNIRYKLLYAPFLRDFTENFNPYDMQSIMQYSLTSNANKKGPIMRARDLRLFFLADTATGLMFYDVKDITDAYQCTAHCKSKPECQNGGFVNHRCKCYCPDYLTGEFCETPITDSDCGGVIQIPSLNRNTTILSPNYPNEYPIGKNCVYVIKAPGGTFVELTIVSLDLAYKELCYHWLEVRYNLIGQTGLRFCSKFHNHKIVSSTEGNTNLMLLKFDSMTENRTPGTGFKLSVRAISPGCTYNPCLLGECMLIDHGNHICFCNQGVSGRACDVLESDGIAKCNFELNSRCFFENVPQSSYNWTNIPSELPFTKMYVPDPGAFSGDLSLFVQQSVLSNPVTFGSAVLVSKLTLKANRHCLKFAYYICRHGYQSIKVKVSGQIIWQVTGSQRCSWRTVTISISAAQAESRLTIEGWVDPSQTKNRYLGNVAVGIDDLQLYPSSEPCN